MARVSRVTRRGALSAGVVSTVVLVALMIEKLLFVLLSLLQGASFAIPIDRLFASATLDALSPAGLSTVPLVIGVFLSLWQIAPIGSALKVGHVLARSTLAAGIGAVLALVVSAIWGVVQDILRFLGADIAVGAQILMQQIAFTIGFALVGAIEMFVTALPVVALMAVLLWVRLNATDRNYRVEGMLDL